MIGFLLYNSGRLQSEKKSLDNSFRVNIFSTKTLANKFIFERSILINICRSLVKVGVESWLQLYQLRVVSFDLESHCPLLRVMVGSGHNVYKVLVVTVAFVLAECFMNAGIDELAVVLFLTEGQD